MNQPWRQSESFAGNGWSSPARSVVSIIVGINVAMFILQAFTGDLNQGSFLTAYLGLSQEGLRSGFVWQFFTYMFLHAGIFHLLGNMLVIYFAGKQVERMIGSKQFLILYFAGGLVGGIAEILTSSGVLIGASAGGFAVLVALATMMPEVKVTVLLFFILPITMKLRYLAYGAFGISLFFTVFPPGDNIGHLAHLAGCITGWVFIRCLGYGGEFFVERMMRERKLKKERIEQLPPEKYVSEEIDPILEKISKHGIHSLSREEKKILEKGREKIARRTAVK